MLRKSMLHIIVCALVLAAAPAAVQAQCPTGSIGLDLKTGVGFSVPPLPAGTVGFTPTGALSAVPASASCPAAAGWKKAALKIVIPAGCTQANIVVDFEGQPKLWTVNLGDSPTNDGFAGDAGTTANNAELWILNEDLSLANGGNNPAVINNPLVLQHLALTNGSLKFAVKNQSVSWGNPHSIVQSPATKFLFAIPDTTVPVADQRAIYLGLNRVIVDRADRTGCGARRALITFQ